MAVGLGPGFRRTTPGQVVDQFTGLQKALGFPAVPLPGLPGVDGSPSDATRLLSAAAHLRPEWDKQAPAALRVGAGNLFKRVAPKRVQEVLERRREKSKPGKAAAEEDDGAERDTQKHVPLGLDYAHWVHRRVLGKGQRPVPSHGFDLAEVALSCAQAIRLGWQLRAMMVLAWAMMVLCWWRAGADWAALVLILGYWLACLTDRLISQRMLRHAMGIDDLVGHRSVRPFRQHDAVVQRVHGLEGQPVVPYEQELRPGRVRYHFLGAGKVWYESNIGIDVMPRQRERDENQDSWNSGSDPVLRLLPSADRLLAGGAPGTGITPFTPDDLLRHVESELTRAIRPDQTFHPDNRQDVFAISIISSERWSALTDDQWAGLAALAHDGAGRSTRAFAAPKLARRALCARMVSWDGELLAFVFVIFAYENHFLRVIVRPQVVNPVHPALLAAWRQSRQIGWRFLVRAALLAMGDTGVAFKRLLKPRPARARRPAEDRKQPVVSLREVYSRRHIDDMLQYDDARRYIAMMQGRVFAAVEGFLVDHNVDTQDYRAQITVIQNSGIINSGDMSGVQNQPGAVGSQQRAGGT